MSGNDRGRRRIPRFVWGLVVIGTIAFIMSPAGAGVGDPIVVETEPLGWPLIVPGYSVCFDPNTNDSTSCPGGGPISIRENSASKPQWAYVDTFFYYVGVCYDLSKNDGLDCNNKSWAVVLEKK